MRLLAVHNTLILVWSIKRPDIQNQCTFSDITVKLNRTQAMCLLTNKIFLLSSQNYPLHHCLVTIMGAWSALMRMRISVFAHACCGTGIVHTHALVFTCENEECAMTAQSIIICQNKMYNR